LKEQYFKWYSQELSKDFEMLVFGHSGYPVVLFPTSMGSYQENKDFKLIDSASWFLEQGLIKIYCPDSVDRLSWYNKSIPPQGRVHNHVCYDNMLNKELVPRIMHETGQSRVAVAGCSFGGYHSVNFAFKHPEKVSHLFSMSGAFDIKSHLDGYYDSNVYFNNPPDFLANLQNPNLWNINIVLGTSEWDICRVANEEMSTMLKAKNIKHWLDMRGWAKHDWPIWREMFPHYLSLIK